MLTRKEWTEALVAGLCGTFFGVALAIALDWRGMGALLAAAVGGSIGFVSYRPTVVVATLAQVACTLAVTFATALRRGMALAASGSSNLARQAATMPVRVASACWRFTLSAVETTKGALPTILGLMLAGGIVTMGYLLFALAALMAVGEGSKDPLLSFYLALLAIAGFLLPVGSGLNEARRKGKPIPRFVLIASAAARLLEGLIPDGAAKGGLFWKDPEDGRLFHLRKSLVGVRRTFISVAFLLGCVLLAPVTVVLAVVSVLLETIVLLANRPRIAAFSGGAVGALTGALAGPTIGLPPVSALAIGAAACAAMITGAVGAYRVLLAPAPNHV